LSKTDGRKLPVLPCLISKDKRKARGRDGDERRPSQKTPSNGRASFNGSKPTKNVSKAKVL